MPFIHIYAYSGRDREVKEKAAVAIVKVASEILGTPENTFSVAYEDVDREDWEETVQKPIIDPLRDKMLIDRGELL